jgi:hypothetical protein
MQVKSVVLRIRTGIPIARRPQTPRTTHASTPRDTNIRWAARYNLRHLVLARAPACPTRRSCRRCCGFGMLPQSRTRTQYLLNLAKYCDTFRSSLPLGAVSRDQGGCAHSGRPSIRARRKRARTGVIGSQLCHPILRDSVGWARPRVAHGRAGRVEARADFAPCGLAGASAAASFRRRNSFATSATSSCRSGTASQSALKPQKSVPL